MMPILYIAASQHIRTNNQTWNVIHSGGMMSVSAVSVLLNVRINISTMKHQQGYGTDKEHRENAVLSGK